MYPFDSGWRWLLAGRHRHLLEAYDRYGGRPDSLVVERLNRIERMLQIRIGLYVLLSLGAVSTAASFLFQYIPGVSEPALLTLLGRIAGSLTGFVTLLVLFATRVLSQLEADVLMLLILPAKPAKSAKRVRN